MLEIDSLSKRFGDFYAVSDVSFKVEKGEVLGFLGPNGAGKSTTMKMITGFLEPTFGDAKVCGHSILHERLQAQKKIGYVPENAPLYEEMYVKEFLNFVGGMHGISNKKLAECVAHVINICNLEKVEAQKIETLSKGYKRRVSLAQALVHDPDILILDEPTDGLDPNQKHDVRLLIKELSKEKCVLISTHILEEVEEVCDRCVIIGEGRLLFEGTPEELRGRSDKNRIQDVFRSLTLGLEVEGVRV